MSVGNHPLVFVDSNIWLYSFLRTDPIKQRTAFKLIQNITPVISAQVANEVCANLVRRAGYSNARVRWFIRGLYARCRVIGLDRDLLLDATDLRDAYSLSYWDSLIVAAADRAAVPVLYSEDLQDGLVVRGRLRVENPFRP